MTENGKDSPDRVCEKTYNCCGKKFSTLTCVFCDLNFHPSCSKRAKKIFRYLSDSLIIYDEHEQGGNLTSKIDENILTELRHLIAQIKSRTTEQVRQELLKEYTNKTQDMLNSPMFNNEAEFELLKTENILQKELIKELQEKNQLLRDKLKNSKIDNSFRSYAETVNFTKPQAKRVPKIIVKNNVKNSNENVNIKECVTNCITKEKTI